MACNAWKTGYDKVADWWPIIRRNFDPTEVLVKCPPLCAFMWLNAEGSVIVLTGGRQFWEASLAADGADLPAAAWLVSDCAAMMEDAPSHIRNDPDFRIEHPIAKVHALRDLPPIVPESSDRHRHEEIVGLGPSRFKYYIVDHECSGNREIVMDEGPCPLFPEKTTNAD
eukprot:6114682-Pyramimonas_sp.AAC.1